MIIQFKKLHFQFLKEKALFIKELNLLVIADLHLGKATHFRKSGIPLPLQSADADYQKLTHLLETIQPARVFFLGDLFHSEYNHEWERFVSLLDYFPDIDFCLMKGNHDILKPVHYKNLCLRIEEEAEETGIIFSHHPMENVPARKLNIAGHIHPGIELNGRAREYFRLPCFWLSQNQLILPAFGKLTGLAMIQPSGKDRIFAVTNKSVVEV